MREMDVVLIVPITREQNERILTL